MDGMHRLRPRARLAGIGGPAMLHAGLQSCFPMDPLSVMGLTEVLPRLPALLALRRRIIRHVVSTGYDALVTIDSPDFSLGVARRVRRAIPHIPCVHYVSPTVWAWRPGRVRTIAASVDHVMTLFPFESEHLQRAGIACTFTGHPIADCAQPDQNDIGAVRASLGFRPDSRITLLLPGSRAGEVRRHADLFTAVAARLASSHPDLEFAVVMTKTTRPILAARGTRWPPGTRLFNSSEAGPGPRQKHALFAAAHAALAVSGTVSIELAAMQTPMVIAYATNGLTARILGAMLTVDTVTLVNLITDTRAVPEHLGSRITRDALVADMTAILDDAETRTRQRVAFKDMMARLKHPAGGAGAAAARTVLQLLDERQGAGGL